MKIKRMLHFEIAGVLLTIYGLGIAFLIDIFSLSAVITTLCFMPLTHILKFLVYRKVFDRKVKHEG